MCLIVAKPRDAKMDSAVLRSAFVSNRDSVGAAILTDAGLIVRKLVKPTAIEHSELLDWLSQFTECPILVHYRYATHGAINSDNAHPYRMHHSAIAHNGIIAGYGNSKISDSRQFLYKHVRSLHDVRALDKLEDMIGTSRLCALLPSGEFAYANHRLGDMHDGCWYSNSNHFAYWGNGHMRHWDTSVPDGRVSRICELFPAKTESYTFVWFDPILEGWEQSIIKWLVNNPDGGSARFKVQEDIIIDGGISVTRMGDGKEVAIAYKN